MPSRDAISEPKSRPLDLAAIAIAAVLASGILGATTNAVNGLVSPRYVVTVLGWRDVADVWRAAIAQGIFEGLLFGVFFALIFATTIGIVTRAACPFGFAFPHLLGVLAGAYVCWAFGGLAGVGLAALSPEFYQRTFFGAPGETGPLLRYAWVGGSIWGVEFGGLFSVVLGLVVLRSNWRRRMGGVAEASA